MTDTLLIIEDESLLGDELRRHYQKKGWEVALTTSLRKARDELFQQHLDPLVVLSDMNLPDGNALDLLEKLRSTGDTSEWVMLSGYGEPPDAVRAIKLGAFDFLTKPCDQKRLDLVISALHAAPRPNAAFARRLRPKRNDTPRHPSSGEVLRLDNYVTCSRGFAICL